LSVPRKGSAMKQELAQKLKNIIHDELRGVHTAVSGKVVDFDPEKVEATIQPTAKYRKPDGELIDFPKIYEVPMYFMQAANQKISLVH